MDLRTVNAYKFGIDDDFQCSLF